MREIAKALCAATTLLLPIAAAAQGTNVFDGTYQGISVTVSHYSGAAGRCPAPPNPRPAPLTIANGAARAGGFEGAVSPEGRIKLRSERAFVVEGRIDPQGNVQAQGSGNLCSWNYVWQKAR
jgi:hypothetical protein